MSMLHLKNENKNLMDNLQLHHTRYLFQHRKTSWCTDNMRLWNINKQVEQSAMTICRIFWNVFTLSQSLVFLMEELQLNTFQQAEPTNQPTQSVNMSFTKRGGD